jgi:hypothetical protein
MEMSSAMLQLIRENASALRASAAGIGAALIMFWISRGTEYHPLAIGILASSVSLLVAMSLFESAWLAIAALLETKTPERRHRRS